MRDKRRESEMRESRENKSYDEPQAMALTHIFLEARVVASALVRWWTAALEAAYA